MSLFCGCDLIFRGVEFGGFGCLGIWVLQIHIVHSVKFILCRNFLTGFCFASSFIWREKFLSLSLMIFGGYIGDRCDLLFADVFLKESFVFERLMLVFFFFTYLLLQFLHCFLFWVSWHYVPRVYVFQVVVKFGSAISSLVYEDLNEGSVFVRFTAIRFVNYLHYFYIGRSFRVPF